MVNTFVFSTCLYLFKEIIKKKLSGYEFFSQLIVSLWGKKFLESEKQEARSKRLLFIFNFLNCELIIVNYDSSFFILHL